MRANRISYKNKLFTLPVNGIRDLTTLYNDLIFSHTQLRRFPHVQDKTHETFIGLVIIIGRTQIKTIQLFKNIVKIKLLSAKQRCSRQPELAISDPCGNLVYLYILLELVRCNAYNWINPNIA